MLAEWKELDVVARREGEEVFPKFVRSVRDGLFWGEITGLSYRASGQRVDLGKLPVSVHSFLSGNYRVRTVSSSRGCNKHCTFCSVKPLFGSRVRFRSSERIEEELIYLLKFNPQRIALLVTWSWKQQGFALKTVSLMKKLLKMGAGISYAELLIPYPGTPIKKSWKKKKCFLMWGGFYYFKS